MHWSSPSKKSSKAWALALVAALAAPMLLVSSSTQARIGQLRTGRNYRLNVDNSVVRGKDVPGLAVNPRNPRHIVEINADWLTYECEYNVSFNGGRTWRGGQFQTPSGFRDPCNPEGHGAVSLDSGVVFGRGQNVYAAIAAARPQQATSILIAKSTNGGRSWRTSVALPGGPSSTVGPEYTYPKLAVTSNGRGGDTVYLITGGAALAHDAAARNETAVFSRSTDGGRTWSTPVSLNRPTEQALGNEITRPVIGRDGAIYVAYRQRGNRAFVVVAKSTDNGRTWTHSNAAAVTGWVDPNDPVTGRPRPQGPNFFTGSTFPRIDIDRRSNRLYLVYGQGPEQIGGQQGQGFQTQDHFINPDMDVFFVRSTDGGTTWSSPRQINDPPAAGELTQTRHPGVYVAPDGRVDIVWHDRRHSYRMCGHTHAACDEARLGDTYYTYSTNGGQTFAPNRRITDRSINNDVGFDYRFSTYWDFGPVLAHLGNEQILFAWMDSRLGSHETDVQDIFLARLNLNERTRRLPVQRVTGSNPSNLSVALSRHAYPGGSEAVLASTFATRRWTRPVIVNQGDFAGALAAGVLGRAYLAPVLLSPASRLPQRVRAEVRRLQPMAGAFVIGGERSLGAGVVRDLQQAGVPQDGIQRLAGSNPADTAGQIALAFDRRSDAAKQAGRPAFDAAVIVNPSSRDAAAASVLAANRRLPILFVNKNSVPQATTDALRALAINRTLVVGGERVVPNSVLGQLPSARRLGGFDAYGTSRAVVRESKARGLPSNIVYVSNGARPLHGALLGAAAGRAGGLFLLTPNADAARAESALRSLGLRSGVDRLIVVAQQAARRSGRRR